MCGSFSDPWITPRFSSGTASQTTPFKQSPSLKGRTRDGRSLGDCLNGVVCEAVPDENRGVIHGSEKLPHILRGGERSRCESGVGAHVRSCLAKKTVP